MESGIGKDSTTIRVEEEGPPRRCIKLEYENTPVLLKRKREARDIYTFKLKHGEIHVYLKGLCHYLNACK